MFQLHRTTLVEARLLTQRNVRTWRTQAYMRHYTTITSRSTSKTNTNKLISSTIHRNIRIPRLVQVSPICIQKSSLCTLPPTHTNDSKGLQASVSVNGGRAELTLPLVGRDEPTTFLLLPTDDVEDIVEVIQKEVGSAVKLQASGNTLAINTTVPRLLKGGDFDVIVGEVRYTVVNPGLELINEYRRLCVSVKNLGELMDAESVHAELVDRAQTRLDLIEKQLEPMEKSVSDARASAHRWTDTWLWGGLVVMSTQFGILARMTWWEYSWDVVEPITYFVTYGTVISTYAMYCITRTSTEYSNLSDRKYLQVLHQNMKSSGISPPEYNALLEERERAVQQLTNLSRREY